jgi:cyclopropane-fatty-acyl-phospholipid synthase
LKTNTYRKNIEKLLEDSGIDINGKKPSDPQIHNPKFYKRVLAQGSIGLGESYMEAWWDCEKLDEFFHKLFSANVEERTTKDRHLLLLIAKARLFNLQTKAKAKRSIARHYDLGNELYQKMLDPLMVYSSGFWEGTKNLAQAQENKLDHLCQKLHLKPGQKVLDIGCGWGGFAFFAAKNHGAKVIGITLSPEQKKIAEKRCENLDVEIRLQDYRDVNEKFDRVISIGMLEHVGHKNYGTYMDNIAKNLNENGICVLSFIGGNKTRHNTDPWINKYIFPNGMIPSLAQIGKAMEGKFVLEDLQNIGLHYDKTLMAWRENFKNTWDGLKEKYGETFYRMWDFYLSCSAAAFRARKLNLWEMVLLKPEFTGEYQPIR